MGRLRSAACPDICCKEANLTLIDNVRNEDLTAILAHVDAGADINQADENGLTPLMIASGFGRAHVVEILLSGGANLHATEPRMGATALHKAAQSGDADVIALLLDHGAFIDQQTPTLGHTALMDAVLHKQETAVRRLLDRGAQTGLRTHYDKTALDLARADDLIEIARLLEAAQERISARAASQALMLAVQANDVEEVRQRIADGAWIDERAPMLGTLDDDYTPLGLAARDGRAEIVRALLEAGADISLLNGLMRATAGHEAGYMGHADVARLLVQHRDGGRALDIDAQGAYNGYTALHDAVWHGHLAVAVVLVEAGARLDLETHAGMTARQLAISLGYDDIARLLSEAGPRRGPDDVRSHA